jgi:signal transduction histidine kinase/DNA-binding response OmpR family regulator
LALDPDNNIWVSTANGICYLKKGEEFVNFISRLTEENCEAHFLERAICAGPDGKIYMGTSKGLLAINSSLLDIATPDIPQVTGFIVFANTVENGQQTTSLNVFDRIKDNTIRLAYNENYFSIDVSTLNYRNISMTVYRYRLDGIDTGWRISDMTNGTVDISYSGLPSGDYTLEVQSSMQGAQWGKSMKLEIVIDPPFWATWWAFIIYILLIAGAVWMGLHRYLRHKREVIEQERKEAYRCDELRLNEMKFRFFTNISHEFRTFLTLIITPLQTLLERNDLPHDAISRLQMVKRSTQSLNTLVNQLLDFRSLEQGGEQLEASVIHLSTLFEPIEPAFSALAADRNIQFCVDTAQIADATFYLDVPKVQKIINNLLSNAFKFTPDGGQVQLRASIGNPGGHLVISVSDTGVGMSKHDLSHIFERFFQGSAEQQDTQLNTGSGIGLNLVKGYTDLHHGEISVESEPGKGTTFTVDLPNNCPSTDKDTGSETADSMEATQEQESDEKMPKEEKVKLLVVEDNKDFRRFMVDMLKDQYTVYAANDGEEALSTARVTVPDIIISDVMMPKMDGYQLCKAVKENIRLSHIPIVLLTAKTTDQDRAEGYQAGADSYITKPFNMSVLQACVQMLLDQRRDRQQEFANETEVNPKKLTITPIDEEFLKKAVSLMEKNMSNSEYDVVAFSSDMAMERTTLYRKMVAVVGKTPLQFMHSVRMKRATVLLKDGRYSVAEVSTMVGYDTVKTFSQHFKKEYGEYPSKYR